MHCINFYCGNWALLKNFYNWKLDEISVFYEVLATSKGKDHKGVQVLFKVDSETKKTKWLSSKLRWFSWELRLNLQWCLTLYLLRITNTSYHTKAWTGSLLHEIQRFDNCVRLKWSTKAFLLSNCIVCKNLQSKPSLWQWNLWSFGNLEHNPIKVTKALDIKH